MSKKTMQDRYKEHVKQTMGKKQPKNSSLTIEKLNEPEPDNNMVSCSNPIESYNYGYDVGDGV